MNQYNVYIWHHGHWIFWMHIRAQSKQHAESMILTSNAPPRFQVR